LLLLVAAAAAAAAARSRSGMPICRSCWAGVMTSVEKPRSEPQAQAELSFEVKSS